MSVCVIDVYAFQYIGIAQFQSLASGSHISSSAAATRWAPATLHSGPPLGVPKERCRSVVCSEALWVLCKVCAVLNMGNVRTSSETATRKLRRSRRLHIQLPDHRQNEPQRNRRLGAASRSRSNSRTYRYRTTQLRTSRRRPKTGLIGSFSSTSKAPVPSARAMRWWSRKVLHAIMGPSGI